MAKSGKVERRNNLVAVLIAAAALGGCAVTDGYSKSFDLPQATYYTVVVRPGDTLSDIAERYDTSASAIMRLSRISGGSRIYAGQVLRVPAVGTETRDAVLAEAEATGIRNFAPAPKPIDASRFEPRARVAVQTLAPPREARTAERQTAARAQPVAPVGELRFGWPLSGTVISAFGTAGNGERNDGINIAVLPGTPIRAAAAGTVSYAGNELRSYGNLVLIEHGDGYITAYAHAKALAVSRGQHVQKGQIIGFAGATGDVDRPQLHFEIRKGVQPINPQLLLAAAGT